jgi:hypothetical protein
MFGLEVSLLVAGGTDLTPELAGSCAPIIGSRHRLPAAEEKRPEAIMNTLKQLVDDPHVDVLGHPTRYIEDVRAVDWPGVFQWASDGGTAIEVNVNQFLREEAGGGSSGIWKHWLTELGKSDAAVFLGVDLHNRLQLQEWIIMWQEHADGRANGLGLLLKLFSECGIGPDRVVTSSLERLQDWLSAAKTRKLVASGPAQKAELPAAVRRITHDQSLQVMEAFRNGPRFWAGRVRALGGGPDLLLKAIIDDAPWVQEQSGDQLWPSDKLRLETTMLAELGRQHHRLAGDVPQVLARWDGAEPWVLRAFQLGRNLAVGDSPFLFNDELFRPKVTEALINYILSYQSLSDQIRPAADAVQRERRVPAMKVLANDIERPSPWLEQYRQPIADYVAERQHLYDSRTDTLVHAQVYPPHIYLNEGRIGMIDWENSGFGNPWQDFVSVWIRGYQDPRWQQEFVKTLAGKGLFTSPGAWDVWNVETLFQVGGNLNYLYWSRTEPQAERKRAAQALISQIEAIVEV